MKIKKHIIPISKPCKGAFGQTGKWRFVKPKIDYSKCSKCKICWLYCPEASIKIGSDGYPKIDYLYCKGCGICFQECPKNCITLEREE
jgi:pyruvate ferredoxin oxidoreductase delta subunit